MLRTLFIAGIALTGVTAMASLPSPTALNGEWAGDRMQLTFTPNGARIEMDCASGAINGPIALGRNGEFAARGQFERHHGGPQRANEFAKPSKARFSGKVTGDVMTLSILDKGARVPHAYTLRKGARLKLVRCL